ncbi:hypothetical protein FA13DRAFT_1649942 [Coprinellus micaceus]|uniref:CxC6 like cysteine cluster associated with KDZ domain-containing protein n=1 Tax=Coprinellus micaceus TaxID=71717 RepID=A0A4Y7S8U4_COPMI|nr:hypothetical protein FA13DRAFT_1649942 [Coprinellus micaceus]
MDVIPKLHHFLLSLSIQDQKAIKFEHLLRFITLSSRLKDDILLPQPATHPENVPPAVLSPALQVFLSAACPLPSAIIPSLWKALRTVIWDPGTLSVFEPSAQMAAHLRHGHNVGLTCQINYHHNFSVYRGERTYYRGVPEVLQVGMHQFAEVRLINSWITLMLVAWVSATNCARFYNTALGIKEGVDKIEAANWQFGGKVTSDHVYSGFTILSLLEDCEERGAQLTAPHTGEDKDRFRDVIAAVNHHRRLSQPEVFHSCNLCTRRYPDGTKSQAVVIDGITIGRRCCAVFNCKVPLKKNRDRFCPEHKNLDDICGIKGCSAVKAPGRRTCADPEHLEVDAAYKLRGQARFRLQQQLQNLRTGNPENSAINAEPDIAAQLDDDEGPESEFTLTRDPKTGALIVTFGRRMTHNEQVFVWPCGMIILRETFYGAEGIGAVIELIRRVFRLTGTMPEHVFFDNNCTLKKTVGENDPDFKNTGLTVDVFHFSCKHSVTDTFCQAHCNPASYPELLGEGDKSWFFNSSIAEQTNVWLGGFFSMCREMGPERYDFFLDEMIRRRNKETLAKLKEMGAMPINTFGLA